jgi:prepilin-type N-terminal cleavage/methylation domain-containing protein
MTNQKGFTLIEIIAVLVILGIMAAVAVPKYLDFADAARQKAAQAAIAEMRGRLSQAQAKYVLTNGNAPTGAALYTYARDSNQFGANLTNLGPDFNVSLSSSAPLTIVVTKVQNKDIIAVIGFFNAAGD